jgi:hypothetical protein
MCYKRFVCFLFASPNSNAFGSIDFQENVGCCRVTVKFSIDVPCRLLQITAADLKIVSALACVLCFTGSYVIGSNTTSTGSKYICNMNTLQFMSSYKHSY